MTPAPIRYLVKAVTLLPILICRQLSKLVPRDSNRIAIGAWYGNFYSDNPKYLTEYLLEHTDFTITWVGKTHVRAQIPDHPRLHFATMGSWGAFCALLRAKFWCCCIFPAFDLTPLPIDGGAVCINLWHGIPVKRVGQHTIWDLESNEGRGFRPALERLYVKATSNTSLQWLSLASDKMKEIMLEAYPPIFSDKRMLPYGSPRNAYLISCRGNETLKNTLKRKYAELLGFDPRKKVILYLPTWRIRATKPFLFCTIETPLKNRLHQILSDNNAILIEKPHMHTYEQVTISPANGPTITIPPELLSKVDTYEMLLLADILVCDYSSVYIDFALLQRPVLHFMYDLESFLKEDMGMAYDIREIVAGEITTTEPQILSSIERELRNPVFAPSAGFKKLVEHENRESCQRFVEFMRGFGS